MTTTFDCMPITTTFDYSETVDPIIQRLGTDGVLDNRLEALRLIQAIADQIDYTLALDIEPLVYHSSRVGI